MTFTRLPTVRWFAVPLVALAAVLMAQVATFLLTLTAISGAFGPASDDWGIWAAKVVASAFMGAVFVGAAWWVAPTEKRGVAVLAFAVVVLWSGVMFARAFSDVFFAWGAAMGAAGLLGAACALWLMPARPPDSAMAAG